MAVQLYQDYHLGGMISGNLKFGRKLNIDKIIILLRFELGLDATICPSMKIINDSNQITS
ncbi:hypothetical protein MTR_7g080990 [Medicago truncatula]|uniref:Uncharacterized protein n=1 Tax=Medicago truncatula TaxID=3880 RepID=G7KSI5_MEDTR|nr:hypothetical protein MTR_7g080990 [Medicago truncatula]